MGFCQAIMSLSVFLRKILVLQLKKKTRPRQYYNGEISKVYSIHHSLHTQSLEEVSVNIFAYHLCLPGVDRVSWLLTVAYSRMGNPVFFDKQYASVI